MKTFRDRLKSYGNAPALASVDDQLIDFDKLVLTVDRLAMRMQEHGVGPGDRIIVMIDNWGMRISFVLAAAWIDADIILSTNPNLYLSTGEALDYAIVLGGEKPGRATISNLTKHGWKAMLILRQQAQAKACYLPVLLDPLDCPK